MKKLELIEGETLICDGCRLLIDGNEYETAWLLDSIGDKTLEFVMPYCEACMLERYDKP